MTDTNKRSGSLAQAPSQNLAFSGSRPPLAAASARPPPTSVQTGTRRQAAARKTRELMKRGKASAFAPPVGSRSDTDDHDHDDNDDDDDDDDDEEEEEEEEEEEKEEEEEEKRRARGDETSPSFYSRPPLFSLVFLSFRSFARLSSTSDHRPPTNVAPYAAPASFAGVNTLDATVPRTSVRSSLFL
ncbi:hypothetical protein KM043_003106 [Ampulex compressa]|nr:hypothetical protein KM043_003106 [Ampulex compressa]